MLFSCLNVRSIKSKSLSLSDFITSKDISALALTETWLGSDIDAAVLAEAIPSGYDIIHIPRENKRGGGVGLIFKDNLKVEIVDSSKNKSFSQFEFMDCRVRTGGIRLYVAVIYRPPSSSVNCSTGMFLEEWVTYLERYAMIQEEIIITGDFNVHIDDEKDTLATQFLDILDAHGLRQHVTEPTHAKGHTLDLLITRDQSKVLETAPTASDPGLCNRHGTFLNDHYAIMCNININSWSSCRRVVSFRPLRNINVNDFNSDLIKLSHDGEQHSVEDMVDVYNRDLTSLIDKHAPLQRKVISLRPHAPWYNDQLKEAKREKRRRERKWRRTKLEVHHQMYADQCQIYAKLLHSSKENHYTAKIMEAKGDPKALFKISKNMLGVKFTEKLPSHSCQHRLAEDFNAFFEHKIVTIRNELLPSVAEPCHATACDSKFEGDHLTYFEEASQTEIRKLILKSPSKSCELDPIPTWLLKMCIDAIVPMVKPLISASLAQCVVPQTLKEAHVRPLLKTMESDHEEMKSYRPVSNLPFLSKLIERVVAARLDYHLCENDLMGDVQSAYRKFHSTETALIKVHSDIASALDEGSVCALLMLDTSAAFDTIDHQILLKRLECTFGIAGRALAWLRSYMTERYQCVVVGDSASSKRSLAFGVPQGSVLGPKLYCMYTAPIADIIKQHELSCHVYADDTQLYFKMDPSFEDMSHGITKLEACVSDIKKWMNVNFLKLNEGKTEFIIFKSKHQNPINSTITIGNCEIQPVECVRNLGTIFDSCLSMEKNVNSVTRKCFFNLRNISRIRRYLSEDACKTLVQSLVTSRLDFGNALLIGLSQKVLRKLQSVQNTAARIIQYVPKSHSITPVLKDLHWLKVEFRIQYKVILMVFKALRGEAPPYIADLISVYQPSRPLRSANKLLLCVPKVRTATYGDRMFSKVAAELWNSLDHNIKAIQSINTFKGCLKTYLFRKCFPRA